MNEDRFHLYAEFSKTQRKTVSIFSTTLSCEHIIGILGCTLRPTTNLSEHTVPKKRAFSLGAVPRIFLGDF